MSEISFIETTYFPKNCSLEKDLKNMKSMAMILRFISITTIFGQFATT